MRLDGLLVDLYVFCVCHIASVDYPIFYPSLLETERRRNGTRLVLDSRAFAERGHCALRSDDTDARKATVRRFGRSDRRALRQTDGSRLRSAARPSSEATCRLA